MPDDLQRARVYAKARWQTPPGQWWGTAEITVSNYENQPITDPEVSFQVAHDQKIENGYGLIWQRSGNTITGRFVAERRTIPAGGDRSFTLGISRATAGVGDLPHTFKVNGESAEPEEDTEPPSTPTGVKLVTAGPYSLSLEWTPSTDNLAVDHYTVMVGVTSGEPITVISKHHSVTVSGLRPETDYSVTVQAVDVAGNRSGHSKTLHVNTTEPLPDAGAWDMPRAPFIDYTSWPTPKLAPVATETSLDGAFLGFLTCPPVPEKPEDTKYWWAGLTRGMYDGTSGIEYPGDATVSDYQKDDLAAFRDLGGKVAFSFGGASNVPLEAVETDISKIVAAYEGIIANYGITHLDFDFEGAFIHDFDGQDRHIAAIGRVIQAHPEVKISYTLPVDGAPGSLVGFNDGGIRLLKSLAEGGIEPSLINGMLMEFGATAPPSLFDASVIALEGMHAAVASIWPRWSDDEVWRRIGACPMFGQNNNGRKFFIDDMYALAGWCAEHNVGCLSGWDISRDKESVSNVEQEDLQFTSIISTYMGPSERLPLVVVSEVAPGDEQIGYVTIGQDGERNVEITVPEAQDS